MPDNTAEIRAIQFWDDNPEVREQFIAYALDQAAHERRISIAYLAEMVRAKDRVNRRGDPCKFNNSWRPVIARLLIRQYPHIRPWIEIRKAGCDHLLDEA
jgi:hypothetical protein